MMELLFSVTALPVMWPALEVKPVFGSSSICLCLRGNRCISGQNSGKWDMHPACWPGA
jgi:hypothetical protein